MTLLERLGLPTDGLVEGVIALVCVFLCGDSGRGSDGRLVFMFGLEARPGPTD